MAIGEADSAGLAEGAEGIVVSGADFGMDVDSG
jgi:hypothetical protein